jgi:hypothetical protein
MAALSDFPDKLLRYDANEKELSQIVRNTFAG